MKHAICTWILGMALAAAAPALAERAVDETREARPDARISFGAVTGEYEFIGTDEARLKVAGTLGEDVEELLIKGDPEYWMIQVEAKRNHGRLPGGGSSSRLVVSVPRGVELEVQTVSGSAHLVDLDGPRVRVNTVSGQAHFESVRPDRLIVETVSGSQTLDAGGRTENRLKSVSGNIRAGELSGRLELNSVSGNVDLQAHAVEEVSLETVSGRILARLEPADRANLRFSSHSGELRVSLPADVPMELRASTFSGGIHNDFGGEVQRGRGPGQRMEYRAGDGSVRIRAESFSGRIHLERLD